MGRVILFGNYKISKMDKRLALIFLLKLSVLGYAFSQTNIALNKKVVSSDITNWTTLVPKAIDGNQSTSILVNSTAGRFFIIDLGAVYTIDSLRIYFGSKLPPYIRIRSSLDNAQYAEIYNCEVKQGLIKILRADLNQPRMVNQHRYIYFYFDPYYAGKIDAELREFEIYGRGCFKMVYGFDNTGNRTSRTIVMTVVGRKSEAVFDSTDNREEKREKFTDVLEGSSISIYPNPTRGVLVVQITHLTSDKSVSIILYDLSGRVVVRKERVMEHTLIDISGQPMGTYILKIFNDNKTTEWKIIKQ